MEDKKAINFNEKRLLITPLEAKEILGVGTNRIYELIKMPGFPAMRLNHRIYVNAAGLQKWIDRMTNID